MYIRCMVNSSGCFFFFFFLHLLRIFGAWEAASAANVRMHVVSKIPSSHLLDTNSCLTQRIKAISDARTEKVSALRKCCCAL